MPDMHERQDRWYHRINPNWVGWAVTFAVACAIAMLSGKPIPPPPPLPDAPLFIDAGWQENPSEVNAIVKTLDFKRFSDTPAGRLVFGDEPDHVYLWDAVRKVRGDILPPRNQGQVGSCVSFGTASAIEHLLCVQIALGKQRHEYKDLVQEAIYGGSRVEIGGGRIRGDGSVGAWGAEWVRSRGINSRGVYGSLDLRAYDELRCKEWGRNGVPDAIERIAEDSPVKGVTLVKSASEARKALAQGYPIAVCSNQGFTFERDADGFAKARGTWAHCMAIVGYQMGSRPGFFVLNSWGGETHRGPRGNGDPSPAGFWAEANTVDRMLGQGDSWAFSDAAGFPLRKVDPIDWVLIDDARPRKHRDLLAIMGAK